MTASVQPDEAETIEETDTHNPHNQPHTHTHTHTHARGRLHRHGDSWERARPGCLTCKRLMLQRAAVKTTVDCAQHTCSAISNTVAPGITMRDTVANVMSWNAILAYQLRTTML